MKLPTIYQTLLQLARATNRDQHRKLSKGARLAVRVRDGTVTLTVARRMQRVGDTELLVFMRDCNVPGTAERIPREGQRLIERDGAGWWCVAWRWPDHVEEAVEQEALDLTEKAEAHGAD